MIGFEKEEAGSPALHFHVKVNRILGTKKKKPAGDEKTGEEHIYCIIKGASRRKGERNKQQALEREVRGDGSVNLSGVWL